MVNRRIRSAGSAVLAVIAWVAMSHASRAQDAAAERAIQPPPPIDTELSRVKNVSIIRIEEGEEDDDIWDQRRDFWRYKQRDHRFGRLRVKDESLLQVLCGEAHISPLHVFGGDNLPDGRYNVVLKGLPKTDTRAHAVDQLSRAFEVSFNITIVREVREISVLTLRPLDGGLENLKKSLDPRQDSDGSQSTSTGGDGVTDVEYQGSLPSFAEYLEEELGEVVVNDVRISGQVTLRFDHESVPDIDDSDYDFYSPETLTELRRRRLEDIDKGLHKYGLTLRRTRQRVKGIFITPRLEETAGHASAAIKQVAGSANQ